MNDYDLHDEECGYWIGDMCDCHVDEYIDWEDENPPRRSKSAPPRMGVSGRSLLTIVEVIGKKARK